jgi:hypothetical protein
MEGKDERWFRKRARRACRNQCTCALRTSRRQESVSEPFQRLQLIQTRLARRTHLVSVLIPPNVVCLCVLSPTFPAPCPILPSSPAAGGKDGLTALPFPFA